MNDHPTDRLGDAAPEPPDLGALAATVEQRGRRRRTVRRGLVAGVAAAAVVVAVVVPLSLTGDRRPAPAGPTVADSPTPAVTPKPAVDAPDACVAAAEATRTELDGEPAWARLCAGDDGTTAPVEVPVDALVSHLDFVGDLHDSDLPGCDRFNRSYRLQIGYADGSVAEITGAAQPRCSSRLGDRRIDGPPDLGVYGAAMAAYGKQYDDQLAATDEAAPLVCPANPRKPDSVDTDGMSASLTSGIRFGREQPWPMPATAVGGILCTWDFDQGEPTVTELTPDEAERVRIGMYAIYEAMVDCGGTPGPTYTAVIEDKTLTRRAVTLITSECDTVVASDGRYGLGFSWLDR